MKKVHIKDLCELRYGRALKKENRKGGSVPVYGSNGIVGYHDKPLVNKKTIIIGRKGSIGEVHLAKVPSWPIDTTYFVDFKVRDINIEWFYRILKTLRLNELNRSAAIPGLNRDDVYRIKIHRPSLDDQIRIATLLSRIEALIATRKDNLHLLDEFLKSTFLEMFGDPVRNEKGWETERLGNLAKVERGRFSPRPRNDPKFYNGDFPFIQTGDISRSNGRLHNYSQTLNEFGIKVSKEFKKDTIVIAIVGATIGETAVLQIDTYAPDSVIGITPTSKAVDSIYLEFLLRFWKPVLKARAPEAARANININTLKPLGIILPSEDLVANFVFAAKKVEFLKTLYQQSLSELENLYGVLSQKAFKGELDLSRIPLEKVPEETVLDAAPETADQFPEPDSYAMSDPAAREKLLRQLFDDFIAERKGQTFSMEIFWTQAEQKVLEHMDDEGPPLGVADYDKAKEWLFELIKSGNIRQLFYEEKNYMGLSIKT
ncbi:MAG: restriction endonuclease subunit S [Deltaproteobacteria bacterium]|nr:restriction endonuclease subunit S [Deltaproteobacteria bacterium]